MRQKVQKITEMAKAQGEAESYRMQAQAETQVGQADHNAQLLVSEYKQRRSEIAQIRNQIQNLEKQCMNLKNQVRQGEYSDAWKFLGRRL